MASFISGVSGANDVFIVIPETTPYNDIKEAINSKMRIIIDMAEDGYYEPYMIDNPEFMEDESSITFNFYFSAGLFFRITVDPENNWDGGFSTGRLASLYSPHFEGNPTAPTQSIGDNSTNIATTEFVTRAITDASTEITNAEIDQIVLFGTRS